MDNITAFGATFDVCLEKLYKLGEVLPLYSEPWIVLGHVIFKRGIDVNQAKIKLIMKLPNLSTVKVLVPWWCRVL